MQGDAKIIEILNDVLTAELTAINQYFIHAKMRENWGFAKLAAVARKESIEEMEDADKLIDRILYLDGTPNLQRYNPVNVGEDVPEGPRTAISPRAGWGCAARSGVIERRETDSELHQLLSLVPFGLEASRLAD